MGFHFFVLLEDGSLAIFTGTCSLHPSITHSPHDKYAADTRTGLRPHSTGRRCTCTWLQQRSATTEGPPPQPRTNRDLPRGVRTPRGQIKTMSLAPHCHLGVSTHLSKCSGPPCVPGLAELLQIQHSRAWLQLIPPTALRNCLWLPPPHGLEK